MLTITSNYRCFIYHWFSLG